MSKHNRWRAQKVTRSRIALERAERLLELAGDAFTENSDRANRYARLAWMLKTRYRVRLSPEQNRKICRKCQSYMVPGATCRVRTRPKRPPHIVITCLRCGYERRIPYKPRKTRVRTKP